MTFLGENMQDEKRKQQRREVALVNTKLLGANRGINLAKRTEIDGQSLGNQKRIVSQQTKEIGTLITKKLQSTIPISIKKKQIK